MEIQSIRQLKELLIYHNCLGIGCEIGVAEGRSSYDFLLMEIEKLYMVDSWKTLNQLGDGGYVQEWHDKNYFEAKERVKEFGDKAIFLKGLSIEMARQISNESLDFFYLDAAHDYENVLADLNAWVPKLKIGGLAVGHDYLNPVYGVYSAIHDFCNEKYIVHEIPEQNINDAGFWFQKI